MKAPRPPQLSDGAQQWLIVLGGAASVLALYEVSKPTITKLKKRIESPSSHTTHHHTTTTGATPSSTTPHHTPASSSSGPKLVRIELQFQYNHYSCLYFYKKVGVYSNGTTKTLGMVAKQQNRCQGLPPIKYVYLRYLSNKQSVYYTYAVMAVFQNGSQKQVATYTHKGPVHPPHTATAHTKTAHTTTGALVVESASVGG